MTGVYLWTAEQRGGIIDDVEIVGVILEMWVSDEVLGENDVVCCLLFHISYDGYWL